MFEAAARLGSLTKAADELCVTPTAVSKQIKQLESLLSTELFIRSTQGVRLSDEGRRYLDRVTEALTILAEETLIMDEAANVPALDIEVGPCFLHFWLLPRLDQFRQEHPDVLLNINVNNERQVATDDSYDVAFFYSPIHSQKQNNYLLFHERVLLVCSPGFLEKHGGHIDISTVFDFPLVMLKDELEFWEGWQTWAEKTGLEYRIPHDAICMTDQVAVIQAAINDAGIALVWDWHVDELLEAGQLVALTKLIDFNDKAYFLSIADHCTDPAAQTFVNWVLKQEQSASITQLY
ncbi:LysR substrate-binding domain-containing protein [Photobacterium sp. DNB23_23_1]|uniref:LysR substrate-binding domain-containing protein n=1 Tax=Photobacterium pectinilyticum TaxID=2906793 RepID=A0ABT1N6H4_9GAMM|nr:LysR substrate-binding domain-containing protein [Photobacterium sp. ZSDE20]MCQ1060350.1 LysR substrate-binding domain-containing protein [Photobacterium sp. ZSDE20]MDD1827673.1 LysR substrate-binding domain-containing protein [Photobacterium sp. ZSDE20]